MASRDIRSLDVAMLRTFDALMRERSVSRAAARLFLSQPAVSASLGRLREVFEDPLFTRTGHGVSPTPRALALAAQVEQLLADLSALFDDGHSFDPARSTRVFRIVGSDYQSWRVLPALTQRLLELDSPIRLAWEAPGSGPLAERMDRGELDLALVARLQMPRDMCYLSLYEDHYVYALRRDHPRAAEPVTLASFCEIPQIFLGYGSSVLDDTIDRTLARAGLQRRVQVAVTSFAQIVHQLEHTDHAAVLGSRVAQTFADRLHLQRPPFDLPSYHSLLCWPTRAERDPGLCWLRAEILRIVGPGQPVSSPSGPQEGPHDGSMPSS